MNYIDDIRVEITDLEAKGEGYAKMALECRADLPIERIIEINSWVFRIGRIIECFFEKDGIINQTFQKYLVDKNDFTHINSLHLFPVLKMCALVKTIKFEFEKGHFLKLNRLAQGEIFSDFLEMGDYLLTEKYKDAAAVIVGGVLEDSLRRLAIRNHISIVNSDGKKLTMEPLNIELGKKEIYDKLIQKQITSWGDLRNKAAHGEFASYDAEQVKMMLLFVEKFCSEKLG